MVVNQIDPQLRLSDDEVDRIFRALADRTRRDIVARTLVGEVSVSALAAGYAMSFAAVQKHVAVLEAAGLVSKHPHGRERLVRGSPDALRRAQALLDQLEQVWRDRVGRLDALFAADGPGAPAAGPPATSRTVPAPPLPATPATPLPATPPTPIPSAPPTPSLDRTSPCPSPRSPRIPPPSP